MHPKPVSHLEIGNLCDGKRTPVALYADVDLRSGQVKSGGISPQIHRAGKYKRQSAKSEKENPKTLARINQNTLLPFSESRTVNDARQLEAEKQRTRKPGKSTKTSLLHRTAGSAMRAMDSPYR
jgi:hypothetical protein